MPTTPPSITPGPTAPQRGEKATFSARLDAFVTWVLAAVAQFVAMGTNVYNNAVEAFNSATTAESAASMAVSAVGNNKWVTGTNYAQGAVVWSPADGRTYRKLAAGVSSTDPSVDTAAWRLLSQEVGLRLLGSAVVSSPVAAIDFLNVLSDEFDAVLIELYGITISASGQVFLRGAVGGAVASGASDYAQASATGTDIGPAISGSLAAHLIPSGIGVLVDSNQTIGSTMSVTIRNVRSTKYKQADMQGLICTNANGTLRSFFNHGVINNTGALSGIRLLTSTGNFTGGTVRVYGYRNK